MLAHSESSQIQYLAVPNSPAPGWVIALVAVFIVCVALAMLVAYLRKKKRDSL